MIVRCSRRLRSCVTGSTRCMFSSCEGSTWVRVVMLDGRSVFLPLTHCSLIWKQHHYWLLLVLWSWTGSDHMKVQPVVTVATLSYSVIITSPGSYCPSSVEILPTMTWTPEEMSVSCLHLVVQILVLVQRRPLMSAQIPGILGNLIQMLVLLQDMAQSVMLVLNLIHILVVPWHMVVQLLEVL